MQVIIIVMLLTYTSLYKIITISLKTIGWRPLVKPSRYRNTMYIASETSADLSVESLEKVGHGGSSTANT